MIARQLAQQAKDMAAQSVAGMAAVTPSFGTALLAVGAGAVVQVLAFRV